MLTLLGSTAADVALSRLNGRNAGYVVDDYYRYQYPNAYDGRYANYDTYLADPFYFDPYQRDVSYHYVTSTIPGVNDLSPYGDWRDLNGYGYAWSPRVATNWAPYQQGYWVRDYPYGMTWVSTEPWGYAPYHYGRWASVDNRWYWIPDSVNTTPRYSPALVGFVPVNQNEIGWVPLAPGDPYVARYYDENWQPHYLTRGDVNGVHLVNMAVPNAVTVVPVDSFGRPVDLAYVRRVDPAMLAQVRPTLEPLLLTPLRNAAINSAWGRGKIDLPPGIAKKLSETPVVVGTAPVAPPFRKDLAKALRLEQVSDNVRNQKLKIRDERAAGVAPSDAARQQQVDALNKEAARGNQDARRQMQELEKQQRESERAQQQQQREAARGQQQQQREAARVRQQQQRDAERVRQQQQREGERVQREQRAQAQRVSNPNRMRRIEAAPAARPVPPPRAEAPRVVNPARPARAEGVRAGNPPKAAAAPRPQPQPQPGRGAEKHENKQPGPPAKAPGGGGGGGGGKGKGKKP